MEKQQNSMEHKHKTMIRLAGVVSIIRLILRSVFVIVAETPEGIALICSSLLCIPILLHLRAKGGCSAVLLYALVEPILSTIFWCLTLYAFSANNMCHSLGDDVCEPLGDRQLPQDYDRHAEPFWAALLIPGLLFDIAFLVMFRNPLAVFKPRPEIHVDHWNGDDPKKKRGIGGIGLGSVAPGSPRNSRERRDSSASHHSHVSNNLEASR